MYIAVVNKVPGIANQVINVIFINKLNGLHGSFIKVSKLESYFKGKFHHLRYNPEATKLNL